MEHQEESIIKNQSLLTSIRAPYTLSNTTPDSEISEEDQVIINNFLGTLAEVAINIATRKKTNEHTRKQEPGQ